VGDEVTDTLEVDIDYLRQRLRYEPEAGKLYWLDYEDMPKRWRTRWAGKEALAAHNGQGYKTGRIGGTQFLAHRVAWALWCGKWPDEQIDHINGVRCDNRITNLRAVTPQENQRNRKKQANNTSGVCGVNWNSGVGKWQARVKVDRISRHLGYFDTLEEATVVRKEAEVKYEFHENYGRG
jgi:HNH endonuclease